MVTAKPDYKNRLITFFEHGHREILKQLMALSEVLKSFHFEGKASRGKNARDLKELLVFFDEPFAFHAEIEEKVIYPFISQSVPKFVVPIQLLNTEHEDIHRRFKILKKHVSDFSNPNKELDFEKWIHEVEAEGTYFIYMLRNHLEVESNSIFKGIAKYLSRDEIERLGLKINAYVARRKGKKASEWLRLMS